MNLQDFNFLKLTAADMAFSTVRTDQTLLAEAKARGFYNGHTPYNKLFSTLFFTGGTLNFKKDLPEEYKTNATRYLKAFIGSFEPKHEEKEAISALLLSELVDA